MNARGFGSTLSTAFAFEMQTFHHSGLSQLARPLANRVCDPVARFLASPATDGNSPHAVSVTFPPTVRTTVVAILSFVLLPTDRAFL